MYLNTDNTLALEIAQANLLCKLLGPLMLFWELLFLPAMAWSWSRNWFALAGVIFHLSVFFVMDINFVTRAMGLTYLIFIDWHRLLHRVAKFYPRQRFWQNNL